MPSVVSARAQIVAAPGLASGFKISDSDTTPSLDTTAFENFALSKLAWVRGFQTFTLAASELAATLSQTAITTGNRRYAMESILRQEPFKAAGCAQRIPREIGQ